VTSRAKHCVVYASGLSRLAGQDVHVVVEIVPADPSVPEDDVSDAELHAVQTRTTERRRFHMGISVRPAPWASFTARTSSSERFERLTPGGRNVSHAGFCFAIEPTDSRRGSEVLRRGLRGELAPW
jgi:hypothetical protein